MTSLQVVLANFEGCLNKCIGDDTKAATRQIPNCILKNKNNKIWRKMIFNMAHGIFTPCNVHVALES